MIYWDTSCVLKLYTVEEDSPVYLDMVDRLSGPLASSHILHSELYYAFCRKEIQKEIKRGAADKLFKKICIEDGVPELTAQIFYLGLKLGGKPATDPKNKKKVHKAP